MIEKQNVEYLPLPGYLEATRAALLAYPKDSPEQATLQHLIDHSVGRANAITGAALCDAVAQRGHVITKNWFQHRLVATSRRKESNWFIGSSNRGFFLLADEGDVLESLGRYGVRLKSEAQNGENCVEQAGRHGFRMELLGARSSQPLHDLVKKWRTESRNLDEAAHNFRWKSDGTPERCKTKSEMLLRCAGQLEEAL
jgi:hypothetical protein